MSVNSLYHFQTFECCEVVFCMSEMYMIVITRTLFYGLAFFLIPVPCNVVKSNKQRCTFCNVRMILIVSNLLT